MIELIDKTHLRFSVWDILYKLPSLTIKADSYTS